MKMPAYGARLLRHISSALSVSLFPIFLRRRINRPQADFTSSDALLLRAKRQRTCLGMIPDCQKPGDRLCRKFGPTCEFGQA